MQLCMAVLISLAGVQAPSVLVKPPLIEVTVLISFRESCLIPDAHYLCFPVYYLTPFSLYSVPGFFCCSSSGFPDGNWRKKAGAAFGVRRLAARKYAAHVQWQQSKCSHFEVMNDNRSNNSSNIFLTLKCQHSINLIMAPGFLLE